MKKIIVIVLLFTTILSLGQRIKTVEGDIKNLHGISQFELAFNYNNVQIPHYKNEKEFLISKAAIREEQKKGSGELFKQNWFDNRKKIYEPMFVKSFNRWYNRKQKTIAPDAEYIIHIKITNIFTGFNVVVINQHSKISAIITVTKKLEPNTVLYKGQINNSKGGKSYEMEKRMSFSYFKLAKKLALHIKRKS